MPLVPLLTHPIHRLKSLRELREYILEGPLFFRLELMETHDDDVEHSSRFLPGIVLLEPVQVFVEWGMQWQRQRST